MHTIKKLLINLCGVVGLLLCIAFIPWMDEWQSDQKYPDGAQFRSRLFEAIKSGRQDIDAAALTPFDWDKICFVGPYVSTDDIQAALGDQYRLEPIDTMHDWSYHLVFGLPDQRTLPVQVSRDFFVLNDDRKQGTRCVTRDDAGTLFLPGDG